MAPEFPHLNRAELWLAAFRRLQDSGRTLAEARRIADEQCGIARTQEG